MVADSHKGVVYSIISDCVGKDEFAFGFVVAPPIIVSVLARIGDFNPMVLCIDDAVIEFIPCRVSDGEIEMNFLGKTVHGPSH